MKVPFFDRIRGGDCAAVMGILNITPDSFSDGGLYHHTHTAIKQAEIMLQQGAQIIDVGGESTRPGAELISAEQELERVIPVVEALKANFDCCISIDTNKAEVMTAAVSAGAHMINDIRSLSGDGCIDTVAKLQVPVCLMHMQGLPTNMQKKPQYDDIISDISRYFASRIAACLTAGIKAENICLDPGFGFGKTLKQNYLLLNQLQVFHQLGYPLLVGMSRKSMIGEALQLPVTERLLGSVSCAVIAAMKGAKIIRVHDVKATVEALKIVSATLGDY